MIGTPAPSGRLTDALPARALIVGVDVERSAVLGMAFDEIHLTGLEDYPAHLAGGAPWPCVVISGVPTRAGRLAAVVSAALAQAGPIELLIDIRDPYGADLVSSGAVALAGVRVVGRIDLWGVPCLRLQRAADRDAIPDLSSCAQNLDVRPVTPADRITVPAEVHAASAARYERRISELQAQIELSSPSVVEEEIPVPGTGRPQRGTRLGPSGAVRALGRTVRGRAGGGGAPSTPTEVEALRRTLRREIARQREVTGRLTEAVGELSAQLSRVELNIAIGAASTTETARHMHSLPAALAEQLGLAPTAAAQLVLFLADRVRSATPRCMVVCGNGSAALWLAHMVGHHGLDGRVVLVEGDPVAAALVARSAAAEGVNALEVRAPVPPTVGWHHGQPVPAAPPPPVDDLTDVGLVLVGRPSGGPEQPACPLRSEQLADDVVVLLARAPSFTDAAWSELLEGLAPVETPGVPGWVVMAHRQV